MVHTLKSAQSFLCLCPNGCEKIDMILREDMEEHRKECPLEVIQCEYHNVGCDVRIPRKRQREHDEENMEKHLRMTKVELTSSKEVLASTKSEFEFRVSNLEMMIKMLTGSGSFDLRTVCSDPSLVASQAKWSMQLAAVETRSLLEDQTCPVIMKFTDIHAFENDTCYWNKCFFSHERGYRMEISLGPDLGTDYVSVFLYVAKGPYDENLRWPLRGKFQISLLNQVTDDEHVTVTITYDNDTPDCCAGRLENDDDESEFVDTCLIASKDLHKITPTCAYLKNDCILVKVCKM